MEETLFLGTFVSKVIEHFHSHIFFCQSDYGLDSHVSNAVADFSLNPEDLWGPFPGGIRGRSTEA
jgi:hypothetical protein